MMPVMASSTIDSLKDVLQNTNTIQDKIKASLELSRLYQLIDLDTANLFLKSGMNLAIETKSEEDIAEAHACLGDIAVMRDSLELAIQEYGLAVKYYKKTNKWNELTTVLIVLGNIYSVKGNYPEAMQYYMEGLKITEEQQFERRLPYYYNNIGIIYFNLKEHDKALEYYLSALKLHEKFNDSINAALVLGNIGAIYAAFNNNNIAYDYLVKALAIYEKMGVKVSQAQLLIQLGELHLNNNQPDSALLFLDKSKEILEMKNLPYRGPKSLILGDLYTKYGLSYFQKEDWEKARQYLFHAYQLGIQTKQQAIVKKTSEHLSKLFEKSNMMDSAFAYHKIYKRYADSISNEENIKELTKLELQYKFEQQIQERELQIEIEKAKQKRKNLIYLIVFCGLLLLLVVFVLLLKLEKNKKAKIDLERTQLRTDLEYKNKELTTHVLYLLKKNEFILSISEKLKGIIPEIKVQNKKHIADVIQELEKGSSTDAWKEFEMRFQEVHNTFFDKLNKMAPGLTPNELRLCAFLRLNMSTKDIAAITYQSVKSIDMARFRLRKKLDIDKDENLVSFLAKL